MIKWVSLLTGIFGATCAWAGPLIEPMAGYDTGTLSVSTSGNFGEESISGTSESSISGPGVGLRAGYVFDNIPLFFAADFHYARVKMGETISRTSDGLSEVSSSGDSQPANSYMAGPVIGTDIPLAMMRIRGWAGYYPLNQIKIEDSSLKGSAFRLGVGAVFLKYVGLNLEYVRAQYNTIETPDGTVNLPFSMRADDEFGFRIDPLVANVWLLSLSLPLYL